MGTAMESRRILDKQGNTDTVSNGNHDHGAHEEARPRNTHTHISIRVCIFALRVTFMGLV